MIVKDAETRAAVGETMGTLSASRTTHNSVPGRRKLPFSLFNTSLQLCPSVHLSVRCKADRPFFTEKANLYIDFQEQHRFCVRTIVTKYFTRDRTIRTCDKRKLTNIVSNIEIMAASFLLPSLHFIRPDENSNQSNFHLKVIPSFWPPLSTFFSSWMCRPLLYNMLDRMLPGLCLFGARSHYPYAQFLMACFQYTCRHSVVCTVYVHSPSDSSSGMSIEHKPLISCDSYQYESETKSINSDLSVAFNSATLSDDDSGDLASDFDVPRNTAGNVSGNSSAATWPSRCSATVQNDTTANVTDEVDDNDDDVGGGGGDEKYTDDPVGGLLLKKVGVNCMSAAPFSITSMIDESRSTDESHFKSSFFIRASNSDTSDDEGNDDDDGDDDDAASDDEFDCCYEDDSEWTISADAAHCFLVDLDPFKVNGIYIPQTSNVPVSHLCHLSLPVGSAAEIESESERALKRINDTWQQWYNDDVKSRTLSHRQHQTKHVCIFMSCR